ncbi:MAG: efflux RND transporter periplasmic adaptor subunit [Gammaproteobacteria bacterium]|nr:efflux RND transporter periplasmic adaptor subunit [Gammaproteobacteria bacterium]
MFSLRGLASLASYRASSLASPFIIFTALAFSAVSHAEEKADWAFAKNVHIGEERVLDAVVEAVNQATISAQTSGRVVKLNADVDDAVKQGDILVEFRNKDQMASYKVAKAAFDEAESEFKRIEDIYSKKLVAKTALDRASASYKSAKARLEQANEALENTIVRAPYSGIVVKRHIEIGELAKPGQALMTGLSLETLRANVDLPQDLVKVVREQKKATAILKDGNRLAVTKITVSPYADSKNHTFQMRAELPKGDYGIYPGMFIKVAIVHSTKQSLLVPAKAVAMRSEVSAVYVKDKENKLSFRQVRVGAYIPASDSYEILAGLERNEKVMLDPVASAAKLKLQE